MDSAELVTAIRTSAMIPSTDPVYTDAKLRSEATDALHTIVERLVVNTRSGFWLKKHTVTTVAGTTRYRVPYRAVAGVAEAIYLGTPSSGDKRKPPPYRWLGDYIEFDAAPDADQSLTFEYYLRPSRIVETQTAGRITAIDTATAFVTLNAVPNRMLGSGAPASIASIPAGRVDIVKPNGWHEVVVPNAFGISGGGTDFVIAEAQNVLTDLSDVEVGDYVRFADESDWPCMPDDFHRVLVEIAAANVLQAKNLIEKASALRSAIAPALERLQDLMTPRTKNDPPAIVPSVGILRRRGSMYRDLPR